VVGPFDKAPLDCLAFHVCITESDTVHSYSLQQRGQPKELISDNGSQFVSWEFEMLLQDRGIIHYKSSVYYPCANGEIERFKIR